MIPKNRENRKARINLTCPACGMKLTKGMADGFIRDSQTYCCQGCAEGTGCTCFLPVIQTRKSFNRPGSVGHRNSENTARDNNQNEEVDTSGHWFGHRKETKKSPPRQMHRGARQASGEKVARSQQGERPSTREQARGRSEFPGSLNKRHLAKGHRVPRLSRTGTKSG